MIPFLLAAALSFLSFHAVPNPPGTSAIFSGSQFAVQGYSSDTRVSEPAPVYSPGSPPTVNWSLQPDFDGVCLALEWETTGGKTEFAPIDSVRVSRNVRVVRSTPLPVAEQFPEDDSWLPVIAHTRGFVLACATGPDAIVYSKLYRINLGTLTPA